VVDGEVMDEVLVDEFLDEDDEVAAALALGRVAGRRWGWTDGRVKVWAGDDPEARTGDEARSGDGGCRGHGHSPTDAEAVVLGLGLGSGAWLAWLVDMMEGGLVHPSR
jgi:hypothetical protein